MNDESFGGWVLKRKGRGEDAVIAEVLKNLRVFCERLCDLCVSKKQPARISRTLLLQEAL